MENSEFYNVYMEEVRRIKGDFFTFGIITDDSYDLIKTRSGIYFCRNCATEVQPSLQCPNCNYNIDWEKGCISIEDFVIVLLKNDKSDTNLKPTEEFANRVKKLSDDELTKLSEELFDDIKQTDVELIKAVNYEIKNRFRGSFNKKATLFQKLLSFPFEPHIGLNIDEEQFNKWVNHIRQIEKKAMKFVIETIHEQK